MDNLWPGRVSDKTVRLFNRWMENFMNQGLRSTFIPNEEERSVWSFFTDRNGKRMINIDVLRGYVGISDTSHREKHWTDVDELGVIFHEELPLEDQVVILASEDPHHELDEREKWNWFLRRAKIGTQRNFDVVLERAVTLLQQLLAKRGIVKEMKGEHELHGWKAIAKKIRRGVSTTIAIAKNPEERMPVTILGSQPFSTEERLDEWLAKKFTEKPYWKNPPTTFSGNRKGKGKKK